LREPDLQLPGGAGQGDGGRLVPHACRSASERVQDDGEAGPVLPDPLLEDVEEAREKAVRPALRGRFEDGTG
jgi:hypothetical protein